MKDRTAVAFPQGTAAYLYAYLSNETGGRSEAHFDDMRIEHEKLVPDRERAGKTYRFAFNGKERDIRDFGTTTNYDYGFRIYSPATGKFLSVDPLSPSYPMLTPYQYASNTPIGAIDLDGLEAVVTIYSERQFNGLKKAFGQGDVVEAVRIARHSLNNLFVDDGGRVDLSRWARRSFEKKWGRKRASEIGFPNTARASEFHFESMYMLSDQVIVKGVNYETGEIEEVGVLDPTLWGTVTDFFLGRNENITMEEFYQELVDLDIQRKNTAPVRVDERAAGGTAAGNGLDFGNMNPEEGRGTSDNGDGRKRGKGNGPGDTTTVWGQRTWNQDGKRHRINLTGDPTDTLIYDKKTETWKRKK